MEETIETPPIDPLQEAREKAEQQRIARFNAGILTDEEYLKLPKYARELYARTYGRPKSTKEHEVGRKREVARRHAQKKAARRARGRTRV